jgi:hypothetical protein
MCAKKGCVALGRRDMYKNAAAQPEQRRRNTKVRRFNAHTASANT